MPLFPILLSPPTYKKHKAFSCLFADTALCFAPWLSISSPACNNGCRIHSKWPRIYCQEQFHTSAVTLPHCFIIGSPCIFVPHMLSAQRKVTTEGSHNWYCSGLENRRAQACGGSSPSPSALSRRCGLYITCGGGVDYCPTCSCRQDDHVLGE